jgi:hypothetical protein
MHADHALLRVDQEYEAHLDGLLAITLYHPKLFTLSRPILSPTWVAVSERRRRDEMMPCARRCQGAALRAAPAGFGLDSGCAQGCDAVTAGVSFSRSSIQVSQRINVLSDCGLM